MPREAQALSLPNLQTIAESPAQVFMLGYAFGAVTAGLAVGLAARSQHRELEIAVDDALESARRAQDSADKALQDLQRYQGLADQGVRETKGAVKTDASLAAVQSKDIPAVRGTQVSPAPIPTQAAPARPAAKHLRKTVPVVDQAPVAPVAAPQAVVAQPDVLVGAPTHGYVQGQTTSAAYGTSNYAPVWAAAPASVEQARATGTTLGTGTAGAYRPVAGTAPTSPTVHRAPGSRVQARSDANGQTGRHHVRDRTDQMLDVLVNDWETPAEPTSQSRRVQPRRRSQEQAGTIPYGPQRMVEPMAGGQYAQVTGTIPFGVPQYRVRSQRQQAAARVAASVPSTESVPAQPGRTFDPDKRASFIDRRVPRFDESLFPDNSDGQGQVADEFAQALDAMDLRMPAQVSSMSDTETSAHVEQLVREELEKNRKGEPRRYSRSKLKMVDDETGALPKHASSTFGFMTHNLSVGEA